MTISITQLRRSFDLLMTQTAETFALGSFADDAGFVAEKGSPAADADRYFNTTLNRIRVFQSDTWHTVGGSTL